MDLGLDGRVALVVGGSGRIGRETARQLRAEGATVIIAGRSAERLDAAVAELGEGVGTHQVDTADEASIAALVAAVTAEHGRIDILVNTAAPPANTIDRSRDRDPVQILSAIDGKALGYLRVANAALPGMLAAGWGRIVTVAGQLAWSSGSLTAASRNAVASAQSKVMADACAGSGVSVNVVHPGTVVDVDPDPDIATGSPGQSTYSEVAAAIVFLCSEQARGISGETLALGHRVRGALAY